MSDHDSPPPPKPDPILVVSSQSSTPSALTRNQKILFGGLGLAIGMFVGAMLISLLIQAILWLVGIILGQNLAWTDIGLSLRIIALIVGVLFGSLIGYSFATDLVSTPDRRNRLNPLTPQRMLMARQVIWSLVAFCIGSLPGGVLASLFVTLLFLVLNVTPGQELHDNADWVRLRTVFVLVGMVLGGIAGVAVSLPFTIEEEQAKAQAAGKTGSSSREDRLSSSQSGEMSLTRSLLQSAKYIVFLITNTARLMMPSPIVTTQHSDRVYINETSETFEDILKKKEKVIEVDPVNGNEAVKERYVIELDDTQRDIILKNWLPQIEWTNGRANRERDANELISWWQLVVGALIPFVATVPTPILGVAGSTVVAILGIFVTILTGLIRFRRPEERWKHYRRLTEDYQRELWNFISLNDPDYKDQNHRSAFKRFNEKMTVLRQNDVRVFLGEVAVSTQNQTIVKPETQSGASQP